MKTSSLESKFIALWNSREALAAAQWVGELPSPRRELRFHAKRKWRFDFAWPGYRVAVEMDGGIFTGGRHSRGGPQYADGAEKRNAATMLGWRVLTYTTLDVRQRPIQMIQEICNLLRQGKIEGAEEQLSLFSQ